ncbi:MAG: putative lipid II flippase FtsW [Pyrinomonadaceae bacterium]
MIGKVFGNSERMDWVLFAVAAGLAVFGSVMVYSASAMMALKESGDQSDLTYFYKQFAFMVVGLAVMLVASRFDYRLLQGRVLVYAAIAVTFVLVCSVYFFPAINGAHRWIRLGGFSFQPSELAKITLPLYLAYLLARNERTIGDLRETVLPCIGVTALICGPVLFGPDLGTTLVLCAVFGVMYFTAGARILHLLPVAAAGLVGLTGMLIFAPFRMRRLVAFLDPCDKEHAADAGYQVCQALLAVGSGGVLGEGFAKGQQKLFYLPYPYSDFIFAVVGEELGLIGTLAVVIAFAVLLWRGARAALKAPDRFGNLLGIGLVTGIIVQALFNISVVISILPAKGIPLPFISYGGSSVVITMLAVGLLLSISRASDAGAADEILTAGSVHRRRARAGAR